MFGSSGCFVDPFLIAPLHVKILTLRPCTKRHLSTILFVEISPYWVLGLLFCHPKTKSEWRCFFFFHVSNNDNSCSLIFCTEPLHFLWYTATLENLSNTIEKERLVSFVADFSSCLIDHWLIREKMIICCQIGVMAIYMNNMICDWLSQ